MMKPIRSALCLLAGVGLVLSQPALAAGTRSGDSVPASSVQGNSHGASFIDEDDDEFPIWWIVFGVALLGGLLVIASDGSDNDSPG